MGNTKHMNAWDNGAMKPNNGMPEGELQALAHKCVCVILCLGC
jgi:hypothetical protein